MLKVAVWALRIESSIVFSLAAYMLALGFTHDKEWFPYLGVIAMALSASVGLFLLSQGVNSEKRWSYSPAILANLIALGVSKYQFEAGLYFFAIPLSLLGSISLVTLLWIFKKSIRN